MAVTRYIVSYDICDPKRLRKVAKVLQGYGQRLQYSVFECLLNDLSLPTVRAELASFINHSEDQVLFISLGSDERDTDLLIKSVGLPYTKRTLVSIV